MQTKVRLTFFVLLIVALATLFQAATVLAEGIPTQGGGARVSALGGEEYTIGAEDVIQIDVWQHPELSKSVKVRFDGTITYDLVGVIKVAGRTPSNLRAELRERLIEFVRDPKVTVSVVEFNSRKVTVLGEIKTQGTYLLSYDTRLLEILTKSGWDRATADLSNITIMRNTGEVLRVDLAALLYKGDMSQNVLLQPNDTIFVPEKKATAENSSQIFVMGEVVEPGVKNFPVDQPTSVKELILSAKGVTKEAALEKAKVIRSNKTEEAVNLNRLIFQGDMSANLPLYPGDTLYVPKTTLIRFYALGMIGRNGVYEAQPEHATVLNAISLGGMPRFGAVLSATKIVRGWPNNPVVINCNLEDLLNRGDLSQNIQLEDGDVIYVPESFLSNVLDVVSRILGPAGGTINLTTQWEDAVRNQ